MNCLGKRTRIKQRNSNMQCFLRVSVLSPLISALFLGDLMNAEAFVSTSQQHRNIFHTSPAIPRKRPPRQSANHLSEGHHHHPIFMSSTDTFLWTKQKQPNSDLLLKDFSNDIDKLTRLRPSTTEADVSAPFTLISAGSSYTRLWTSSTWQAHSRPPHKRYARHILRWYSSTTARQIFPAVSISVLWATLLSILSSKVTTLQQLLLQMNGGMTAVSLLTAPLALLLTLRANSSLSRLQEGRALWGRLVLHSRTLSSLLRVYLLPNEPTITLLAARHLALLGWCLKAYVRGESKESEKESFQTLLDPMTTEWLLDDNTKPPARNALTSRIRYLCAMAIQKTEGVLPGGSHWTTPHILIEEQIANLEQVVGGCERLYGSPIPPTYSRHLSRVMSMFLFFMPVGLVASSMSLLGVALISAIASYVFVGIDEVGMEIENAFTLLPLQQLASASTNGVRDQLVMSLSEPPLKLE